jgi:NAD-dependent deacetylase
MPTLQQLIDSHRRAVFFGGAGVSTESGIPDFRSVDGLYNQTYAYPPETILSHSFFERNPEEFYRFYRDKMLKLDVRPNAAHQKLALLEAAGRLSAVVTQNIDGLHQAAGSRRVFELHGSIHRNHCLACGKTYDARFMLESSGIPRCACGGLVRPDVVLYEEGLDERVLEGAVEAIAHADLLIIGGTSLAVYPAAGLLQYFRGDAVVQINRDPTPYDGRAALCLHERIGEVLSAIQVNPV